MPPSTVFSYWRRDHRRSAAPAPLSAPSTSWKGVNGSPGTSPPQLPAIPDTPTLASTFDDSPLHDAPPSSESPLENDVSKMNINSFTVPLSSSVSLAVPSPSVEKDNRPHSSPGEHDGEPAFTSQSNNSQLSITALRSDQGDGEPDSKPSSPFRRSFGKGLRNLQTPSTENQKRSPTAGHFRFRTSPEDSPADKNTMPQREFVKVDATAPRRTENRDVSTEHAHHRPGKAMLHLLNPISLLARRRSSQMTGSRTDNANIGAQNLVPAIPDDYDPRIRGNIVHDFSAPRPRRNVSGPPGAPPDGQDSSPSQNSAQNPTSRWADQNKRNSDHSPVFKEHFDDQNVLQVENKGYLQSPLLTNPPQSGSGQSVPVFARKLPSRVPEQSPEPVELEAPLGPPPAAKPLPSPPKTSPPTEAQDQDTIPHVPPQPSGLPKRFKSNASRFSFDMNGVESSVQEKLLEEKHKEKEAARKLEDGYFDDFDDEFDHEIIDDLDGLEEKIPGVNVDADDDDDFTALSVPRDINGEIKSWAVPGLSPVVASPITPAAPPDVSGDASVMGAGYAPPTKALDLPPSYHYEATQLSVHSTQKSHQSQSPVAAQMTAPEPIPPIPKQQPQGLDDVDDDLYFDDGEFGDLTFNDQEETFDESIFDDETSHLYDRKPAGTQAASMPSHDVGDSSPGKDSLLEDDGNQGLKHMPSVASEYRVAGSVKRGPLGERIPNMGPARAHAGVLTEQNLEVLHNALTFAANEAANQGRFDRTFSTSDRSLGQDSATQHSQTGDSQPGLVSDDNLLSQAPEMMGVEDAFEDLIYDDNEDAYYDDPIVAAANAEALENDDDGFYGQEFGFYAQANGNGASELTNGGYFGPRGVEGVSRSFSSRGKFQEPSLTPITERSEWSNRNSVISLKAHNAAHSNPSLSSPGLAQLVDMRNLDDEMSLSALMKLRRGAWGGSNGSLRSSTGSPPPHTLSSSHRGSFTGASEASPTVSDIRPFSADEGLAGVGYHPDDIHPHVASPLKDTSPSGRPADLPTSGIGAPTPYTDGEDDVPARLHNNVL
ncbi:hypothetical protein NUU61_007985 [Penicillium alfredii]|uniref:AGC-kinase C-terminal domain-containing protein n=1 Tax=Penicillium alfredii TaxID=1506179 RepID=A0A9W9ERH9_9EURO|nr:uncharacterized protein NUU61_007985 [Penicillium alfredii]KAJ5086678.1 hypothetical protein NUU61_007985 [Penicillium alfredii]